MSHICLRRYFEATFRIALRSRRGFWSWYSISDFFASFAFCFTCFCFACGSAQAKQETANQRKLFWKVSIFHHLWGTRSNVRGGVNSDENMISSYVTIKHMPQTCKTSLLSLYIWKKLLWCKLTCVRKTLWYFILQCSYWQTFYLQQPPHSTSYYIYIYIIINMLVERHRGNPTVWRLNHQVGSIFLIYL